MRPAVLSDHGSPFLTCRGDLMQNVPSRMDECAPRGDSLDHLFDELGCAVTIKRRDWGAVVIVQRGKECRVLGGGNTSAEAVSEAWLEIQAARTAAHRTSTVDALFA